MTAPDAHPDSRAVRHARAVVLSALSALVTISLAAARSPEGPAGMSLSASRSASETVLQAQREIRAGRFAAAEATLAALSPASPVDAARLALGRAELTYYRDSAVASPSAATIATVRAALGGAEATGDRALVAEAQDLLALVLYASNFRTSEHEEARALLDRALATRREIGDLRGVAESLFHLGLTWEHRKEPTPADTARAGELYRESLAIAKANGFGYEASYTERHLAGHADDAGDLVAARTGFERSLALRRETGATLFLPPAMVALADVVAKEGDVARATALYAEAQSIARSIPAPRFEAAATAGLAAVSNPPRFAGPAELVLPGIASTEWSEVRFSRTPDGRWAIWGSTDRPGGPGGWDLWMSDCRKDPCTAARPVSLDTPAKEFDPVFSADGRLLYFFFSNREGGFGGDDLYAAEFDAATGTFGAARNLGPELNSPGDEWAPTPSADGRRLLFATDGRGGAGKHDLFVARRATNGGWEKPTALPGAINTPLDDFDATWLADGETIVFSRSLDANSAAVHLYWSRRVDGEYGAGVRFGPEINVAEGWTFAPLVDWQEPNRLLFTSHHEPTRRGKLDLYSIRFVD